MRLVLLSATQAATPVPEGDARLSGGWAMRFGALSEAQGAVPANPGAARPPGG